EVPLVFQLLHCGAEEDGFAQVAVPVGGVQGGGVLDPGAFEGGEEGDLGAVRFDAGEHPVQLVLDALDVGGVGGVVDGDPAGSEPGCFAFFDEAVEEVGVAGDDGRFGAVDDGDGEPVPACDEFFDVVGRCGDGDHAAGSGERSECLGAEDDDAGGVLQ